MDEEISSEYLDRQQETDRAVNGLLLRWATQAWLDGSAERGDPRRDFADALGYIQAVLDLHPEYGQGTAETIEGIESALQEPQDRMVEAAVALNYPVTVRMPIHAVTYFLCGQLFHYLRENGAPLTHPYFSPPEEPELLKKLIEDIKKKDKSPETEHDQH